MLSRLGSLISTYVTPYVSRAVNDVQTHQVESLAIGVGAVALLLTLLVVVGSSWQPHASGDGEPDELSAEEPAVAEWAPAESPAEDLPAEELTAGPAGAVLAEPVPQAARDAAADRPEPVATAEFALPVPVDESPAPAIRPVLAAVQDVLPGTPLRFAPEVALPGRVAAAAQPLGASDPPFTADAVTEAAAALQPQFDLPEPRPAADADPAPYDTGAPLSELPELFNAFAELSQLSSAGRRMNEREDGAA